MSDRTTVVLVHGAWHSNTCWRLVRDQLDDRRIASVAVQLPMTTLDEDAAVVRAAIDSVESDCVVVGHSWGGSPVTMGAAGSTKVKHLIYLCAMMIEIGQPVKPLPGRENGPRHSLIRDGDNTIVGPEQAMAAFYHDVDPALARECVAALRPFSVRGFAPVQTDLVAAWKTIPSTYVVTLQDRGMPPDEQRLMAKTANASEIIDIDTGHSPFLSRPGLVANIIEERVIRVNSATGNGP